MFQSAVEAHYSSNETNKLLNFMQNVYSVVLQEDEVKSDDYHDQEVHTIDASNEYVSREKIKIRSRDILNRKQKMKDKIKMFATLERLNEAVAQ